jgi:ribose transport system substrate-binding protein
MGGEHLAKLIGEKGNMILLRYAVGSASTEAREAGFMDAHQEVSRTSRSSPATSTPGATRETSYQAAQNLLNRYGRDVNGVFCPCEPVAVGMAKALRDLGYAGGKVKMVGFDTGGQSVGDLRSGDIQGLVVQNPLRMGYEGVMTLVRSLRGRRLTSGWTRASPW